jgi:Flp pilus assembly protein TadG
MKREPQHRRGQRGAVSVEMALVAPLLLMIIVGGVHFGRVLMTRHKLTDATNYATRAAAVANVTNANQIRNLLLNRMGTGNTGCSNVQVTATVGAVLGQNELRVIARCNVSTGIGGSLLGPVGPDTLTVSAAMPF